MSRPEQNLPLRFLHIGDLHITQPYLQNSRDLAAIITDINEHCTEAIDFVFLPGDIADNGLSEQFCFVRQQMSRLHVPWHAIPGDHDFEPKSLDQFYDALGCKWLPFAEEINGCVCVFLDIVSNGTGGPDFKLGRQQIDWLKSTLASAEADGKTAAIFMHSYAADLGDEAAEVSALINGSCAVLVDMGHAHYNELANDGRTIYACTRSTGQVQEGDVGFSLIAIDEGVVSWRFKPLGSPWPFVMVTSPSDRRLQIEADREANARMREVRASYWAAAPVVEAQVQVDGADWIAMELLQGGLLRGTMPVPSQKYELSVRIVTADGAADTDTIEVDPAFSRRSSSGSDQGSIGAWPDRQLIGTQLGPNRNGKKW
jgi:Icc protein